MSLPTYQDAMLPVLVNLKDGQEKHISEILSEVSLEFNLTDSEKAQMLPSGQSTVIGSRVGWARTYLSKSGLIKKGKSRGTYVITERGIELLNTSPKTVDNSTLSSYPEFLEWINKSKGNQQRNEETNTLVPNSTITISPDEESPEDSIESAYKFVRLNLASEILDIIKTCSPKFFEDLVVDLLVRMGYGGTIADAGQAIGKSGDGGIDGIIKEDRLGLDVIYLQAKRWENTVGRPEIQKFAGALQGKRASKGVFITTSDYSREAREFVSHINNKIILIDGDELADLMIDYNVGVSVEKTYEIKRIDSDYFIEE